MIGFPAATHCSKFVTSSCGLFNTKKKMMMRKGSDKIVRAFFIECFFFNGAPRGYTISSASLCRKLLA